MTAVKWVVTKLQRDKTASFWEMSGREVTRCYDKSTLHLPQNFMTHRFLDPSAFPEESGNHPGKKSGKSQNKSPDPPSLGLWDLLAFFPCEDFVAFLCLFLSFERKGWRGRKKGHIETDEARSGAPPFEIGKPPVETPPFTGP